MTEGAHSELTLDASDFISESQEAAQSQGELQGEADTTQESLFQFDAAGAAASSALIGVGAAASEALQSTQEMRSSLDRTGVRLDDVGRGLDATSSEMNALARDTSDATFPLEDVTQSFENLSQLGVESAEDLQELALASDNVADATGSSAAVVSDSLAPSIRALDGNLDNLIDNQDAYTIAANETSLSIEDIGSTLERLDFSQLQEMGVTSEEVTGLMSMFAEETGYSGRVLRSEFNQAIAEADGDLDELHDELGLGDDALDQWNERISGGTTATDEYAEAANNSVTTLDRLRQGFDELRLQAAEIIGPIDAIGPALSALGGVAMVVSQTNLGALSSRLGNVTQRLGRFMTPVTGIVGPLGAKAAALGTVGTALAALPLAAVVGGVAAIATNFGGARDQAERVATVFRDEFGPALDQIPPLLDGSGDALQRFGAVVEPVVGRAAELIADTLIVGIRGLGTAIDTVVPPATDLINRFGSTTDETTQSAGVSLQSFREAASTAISGVQTAITTAREGFTRFREGVTTAMDLGRAAIEPFRPLVVDSIGGVRQIVDETRQTFDFWAEHVGNAMDRGREAITTGVTAARETFGPFMSFISEQGERFRSAIVPPVQSTMETFRSAITTAVNVTEPLWSNAIGAKLESARTVFGAIETVLRGWGDTFTSVISSTMMIARGDFSGAATEMRELWSRQVDRITSITDSFRSTIVGNIERLRDGVVGTFENLRDRVVGNSIIPDMVSSITSYADTLEEETVGRVRDLRDNAVDEITSLRDDGVDRVTDLKDDAVGLVEDLASETVSELGSMASDAVSEVEEMASDMIEEIDIVDRFKEIGGNLISGLADGVRDAVPDAAGAVEGAVDTISGFFPESPADEGPLSGTDWMTGIPDSIIGGIHDRERHAAGAAADLAESARPGLGSSGSGSSSSSSGGGLDRKELEKAFKSADRTDELLEKFDAMIRALQALDSGDVSEKDVLKALHLAEDRNSGRNPHSYGN